MICKPALMCILTILAYGSVCARMYWRIGVRDGGWDEFGAAVGGKVEIPSDWAVRSNWSDLPYGLAEGKPLIISWSQEERRPLLVRTRLLHIPCTSSVEVEAKLNGQTVYRHRYNPVAVWLHEHFDISLDLYLPVRFQTVGENALEIALRGGEAKIDFLELTDPEPGGEMWLYAQIGQARWVGGVFRRPDIIGRIKTGLYPLEWVDFDCCSVPYNRIESERGRRGYPEGSAWSALEEVYKGTRIRPMSNIAGIPRWNSKFVKTGKASNPDWKEGCGKVIHYHDYWVGGDLLDYDAWEDFIAWDVSRSREWVELYRGLGEWDVHWFGNGGSWEGFFEYWLRFGRGIKRNDPDSFVILSGNHTSGCVDWDAEAHGLPRERWFYYERLTDNRELFRWFDGLGFHPYEYNNRNPEHVWIAAEHLRTLLDRKGLQRIEVAVDEWGHDLGFQFVREALPRLIHGGTVNKIMVDWNIVEGDHDDRFGLIHPDGSVKDREVFECWRCWSELFHGARRLRFAFVPDESGAGKLFAGASVKGDLITLALDNRGEDEATARLFVPTPKVAPRWWVYALRPELDRLEPVSNFTVDGSLGEVELNISVPPRAVRVFKITPEEVDPEKAF